MAFKHKINGLKDIGDKNHLDENVSEHGNYFIPSITTFLPYFVDCGGDNTPLHTL